jgi:hypothetical protein
MGPLKLATETMIVDMLHRNKLIQPGGVFHIALLRRIGEVDFNHRL